MIVVTTPTGSIGHQVLEQLLDSGEPIRAIARDPSRLPARTRERVEIVRGSHDDLDVVTEASAGADRVFWLVPPNPYVNSVLDYYLDFTRPLCEAIGSQGVKRVVSVSTIGRGVGKNAGQVSAALAMDELIERTGVSYRAVCPPTFMENLLQQVEPIRTRGMFFSPMPGDRKSPLCATRDIATVAAELLLDDSWSGQGGVPVLGAEDLSANDMARIMSDVLERPIRFQQISFEACKAGLLRSGMSQAWAEGMVDMFTQNEQILLNTAPRTPESTTPTSFRQWCEDVLRPAVLA